MFRDVQETQDDGLIVGGSISTIPTRLLVIKTDSNGLLSGSGCNDPEDCWAKTYGGDWNDSLSTVQQTNDGGYIIGGSSDSFVSGNGREFLVIKTDAGGNILGGDCGTGSPPIQCWARTYGDSATDYLYSIKQASDGGYILGGSTTNLGSGPGYFSFLMIKTDPDGNVGSSFDHQTRDLGCKL